MAEPLARLHYTLTPADALAYEALPHELPRRALLGFVGVLFVVGMAMALLLEPLLGTAEGWQSWIAMAIAIALTYGIWTLLLTRATHRRARRRLGAPRAVTLELWGDHLSVAQGTDTLSVALETIAAVTTTATHVFIDAPPQVLIVPLAAFPDSAALQAFGTQVDAMSQEASGP